MKIKKFKKGDKVLAPLINSGQVCGWSGNQQMNFDGLVCSLDCAEKNVSGGFIKNETLFDLGYVEVESLKKVLLDFFTIEQIKPTIKKMNLKFKNKDDAVDKIIEVIKNGDK